MTDERFRPLYDWVTPLETITVRRSEILRDGATIGLCYQSTEGKLDRVDVVGDTVTLVTGECYRLTLSKVIFSRLVMICREWRNRWSELLVHWSWGTPNMRNGGITLVCLPGEHTPRGTTAAELVALKKEHPEEYPVDLHGATLRLHRVDALLHGPQGQLAIGYEDIPVICEAGRELSRRSGGRRHP